MVALWGIFSDRYGRQWDAMCVRDEDGRLRWDGRRWANDLRDLTPLEFRAGADRDLDRRNAFPPSAAEFREMATRDRKPEHVPHWSVVEPVRPASERVTPAGLQWLAYMRAELGVSLPRSLDGGQRMTLERAQEILASAPLDDMRVRVALSEKRIREGKRP